MRSIRNRLLSWLLAGVVVLLAVAGSCIYFAMRYVLTSQMEDELHLARKVIYNVFENDALEPGIFLQGATPGRRLRFRDEERWREFDYEDGELIYQLKDSNGEILLKSPSLGDRSIARPADIPDPRKSVSIKLPDGSRLLARVDYAIPGKRATPGDGKESIEIIVARDITGIRKTLSLVVLGILCAGIAASVAIGLLVTLAIRQGLSPLERLGEAASKVDADTLTTRFDDEDMPHELRPICERLNSLMTRLEHSFERERRFSADLAHELRTPIAEISTMAEASVLYPYKVPSDRFEKILATGRRMQQMVESLLSLARREQVHPRLDLKPVNLSEIIAECWEPFSHLARDKQLVVRFDSVKGHSLTTDPGMFRQILNNLFSNAVEYTPEGGSIFIDILTDANNTTTGLSVSNSAGEISPVNIPHLFERFWRQDSSRSGWDHSGLGLSVAKACADILSLNLSAKIEDDLIYFELVSQDAAK